MSDHEEKRAVVFASVESKFWGDLSNRTLLISLFLCPILTFAISFWFIAIFFAHLFIEIVLRYGLKTTFTGLLKSITQSILGTTRKRVRN